MSKKEIKKHNKEYEEVKAAEKVRDGTHQDPAIRQANNDVLIECFQDHLETNGLGETLQIMNELASRTVMPFMIAENQMSITHQMSNGIAVTFELGAKMFAELQFALAARRNEAEKTTSTPTKH